MVLNFICLLLFPALMAFAAASDLFTMTISNRISLLLIAGFVVAAGLSGMAWNEVLNHLGAGLLVLAIAFACFAMGWIGGGDAKLVAATALWFGFGYLLDYLVMASIVGGALTLLILQYRKWPMPYLFLSQPWLSRLHEKNGGVPYGIALAIGALMVYPDTPWMRVIDLTRLAAG
jgi:prepilin peptidase CpaA